MFPPPTVPSKARAVPRGARPRSREAGIHRIRPCHRKNTGFSGRHYTTGTPITAADPLNDRVPSFHDGHGLPVPRIMTDRGTEYCGCVDGHDFRPFLAVNDTDHTKTRVKSPRTDGIRGRFHKTVLQGFHQVAFRKKPYDGIGALRADPDEWLNHYSRERTHQGGMCCGGTPFQTMIEGKGIRTEKFLNQT